MRIGPLSLLRFRDIMSAGFTTQPAFSTGRMFCLVKLFSVYLASLFAYNLHGIVYLSDKIEVLMEIYDTSGF